MTNEARLSPSQVAKQTKEDPDVQRLIKIFEEYSEKELPRDEDLEKAAKKFADQVKYYIDGLTYQGFSIPIKSFGNYNYSDKDNLEYHVTLTTSPMHTTFRFFRSPENEILIHAQSGGAVISPNEDAEMNAYILSYIETTAKSLAESQAKSKSSLPNLRC